jgi:hypothetical protein
VRNARTIRTAAAFASGLYVRVVGFPGDCSFGMTPSSFSSSGASTQTQAIHRRQPMVYTEEVRDVRTKESGYHSPPGILDIRK